MIYGLRLPLPTIYRFLPRIYQRLYEDRPITTIVGVLNLTMFTLIIGRRGFVMS